MCSFSADTLRCQRCGYQAKKLPTFRVCRTIPEIAQRIVQERSAKRIRIPPVPLGRYAKKALSSIGVTPERVSKAMGRDCGCNAKASAMDSFGAAVSQVVENAANAALGAVLPNPYTDDDVAAVATALAKSPYTNAGLKDAASDGT